MNYSTDLIRSACIISLCTTLMLTAEDSTSRARPSAYKEVPALSPELLLKIVQDAEIAQQDSDEHRTNHDKVAKTVREQQIIIQQLQAKVREHANLIQILMRRLIEHDMDEA